jgi:hypothetical protein
MPAGRSARGHRVAGVSGGTAADSSSVVQGQRHENQGRPSCTSDVEGTVDSHRGGSSTVGEAALASAVL